MIDCDKKLTDLPVVLVASFASAPKNVYDLHAGAVVPPRYVTPAVTSPDDAVPWCTTSRHYDYVQVNGVTVVHITETWDGTGDSGWTFR